MNQSNDKINKNTSDLEETLGSTHASDITKFLEENKDSMLYAENPFAEYCRRLIKEKNLMQQTVFLQADIPERYGYKLISGEKKTKQRDVILRICYAAKFTLEETQDALKLYGMPQLYVKIPRDAVLMIVFNERPGSLIDVNMILKEQGMEPLRPSGILE